MHKELQIVTQMQSDITDVNAQASQYVTKNSELFNLSRKVTVWRAIQFAIDVILIGGLVIALVFYADDSYSSNKEKETADTAVVVADFGNALENGFGMFIAFFLYMIMLGFSKMVLRIKGRSENTKLVRQAEEKLIFIIKTAPKIKILVKANIKIRN